MIAENVKDPTAATPKIDRLSDWGEFRLIREVILPALEPNSVTLGDDCAYLSIPEEGDSLVITSDASPKPLAWQLGEESFWVWGWYSVAINVSDLAAAGARPLAFTSSVEAPDSMSVEALRDFFSGVAAACAEFKISHAGGNLQSGPRFGCHGTAVGTVSNGKRLSRGGCEPGDRIAVVGECGRVISAYLRARREGLSALSDADRSCLLTPRTQIQAMLDIREECELHAATDNSDGILGSLWNIVERSLCAIDVDMKDDIVPDSVHQIARTEGIDPWNLMFFWGDWQVVVAVPPQEWKQFLRIVSQKAIAFLPLGHAIDGPPALYGSQNRRKRRLRVIRNEHFTPSSFGTSVEDQLSHMLYSPLFAA